MNIPYIKNRVFEKIENNLKIIYNNTNKVCHYSVILYNPWENVLLEDQRLKFFSKLIMAFDVFSSIDVSSRTTLRGVFSKE